ncbi:DUF3015 domain-containing protein [bacterium]|nr:DUF3015 domain-containing protein [bacterium]
MRNLNSFSNPYWSLALVAALSSTQIAQAGVRHSRSVGGTGQPIPKVDERSTGGYDPNLNQGIPIQVPSQTPIQVPSQGGAQGQPQQPVYQLPAQAPIPVAVPPPMPVQVPQPMLNGNNENTQIPVQLPANTSSPVAAPVPVPAGAPVPVAAPVPVSEPSAVNSAPVPVSAPPSVNSAPVPVAVPAGTNGNQTQAGSPIVAPVQQSTQPLPVQGQPTLPPAPPSTSVGDRYMLPSYGMAGCGLGSMIFSGNQRSEQWLAAITNDGFIPQSAVISTGTSNCVDVDEEQAQAEQEIFIDSNFHTLRLDAARGDGESLRAYADLMGCQKEGLYDTFAAVSQGQHSFIFSDSQPQSIAERFRDALKRSRALKTRCERLY